MEEETSEEVQPEVTSQSIIDKANAAAERIEEAERKMSAMLKRMEQMKVEQMLAGKAEAGKPAEKKPELTPKEYAQKISRGEIV